MAIEIEHKFLVVGDYKSKAYEHNYIEQGYFNTAPGITVRVRLYGDKGFLTIKVLPTQKDWAVASLSTRYP